MTDDEKRKKTLDRLRKRYAEDTAFREKRKAYGKSRYNAMDTESRKEYNKATNNRKKLRYQTDPEYRKRLIEYSKNYIKQKKAQEKTDV